MSRQDETEPVLPGYETAIVLDFEDSARLLAGYSLEGIERHQEAVRRACKQFADIIAKQLVANELYGTVHREPVEVEGLRIHGEITDYAIDPNLFGYIEILSLKGIIYFTDNLTGQPVGEIVVNEGNIATSMIPWGKSKQFMRSAARKVVEEIEEARQEMKTAAEADTAHER